MADHALLARRRCELLAVPRSTAYYRPQPVGEDDLSVMRVLDELHMARPFLGSRRLRDALWDEYGLHVNRKRVRRLMGVMGIEALYPKRWTTRRNPRHKAYPYLLSGLAIDRPNRVWAADITYLPMRKGFLYLVAVMDWYSRKVLSWRLSNSLDADFCLEALEEALDRHGRPEIFNSDQGCQFTSEEFTGMLASHGVAIGMDGKGRWLDNVFVERLWRSLKYEEVYLKAYDTVAAAAEGIGDRMEYYNRDRRHAGLDRHTPDQVYRGLPSGLPEAA